jgi:hypothetical protein
MANPNHVQLSATTIANVTDGEAHILNSAYKANIGRTIPLDRLAVERGWAQEPGPERPPLPFWKFLIQTLRGR